MGKQFMNDNKFEVNDNNWDDYRLLSGTVKLDSVNPPDEESYKDGKVFAFASTVNEKMYATAQMPHDWKEGTDIDFHLHLAIPVAGGGVGVEAIKFNITCSWVNIGDQYPESTPLTNTIDIQNELVDAAPVMEIDVLSGAGKTFSSTLIISLERDTDVVNDYANDIYVVDFDIHYQKNKLGSDNEEPQ